MEDIDTSVGASCSYDPTARTMVSYDIVQMGKVKADFIKQRQLGGGMWWENSGDKSGRTADKADGSLVGTFVGGVGCVDALNGSANVLGYPESK